MPSLEYTRSQPQEKHGNFVHFLIIICRAKHVRVGIHGDYSFMLLLKLMNQKSIWAIIKVGAIRTEYSINLSCVLNVLLKPEIPQDLKTNVYVILQFWVPQ